jgi:adenylate cyclase
MFGFWGNKKDNDDSGVSADFQRALTHEVMSTELLRIRALIGTTLVLSAIVWTVYFIAPDAISRVWHGNLKPQYLY